MIFEHKPIPAAIRDSHQIQRFWRSEIANLSTLSPSISSTQIQSTIPGISAFDICYQSADGVSTLHGTLLLPVSLDQTLDFYIDYHGYMAYHEDLSHYSWIKKIPNLALFVPDTRGQKGKSEDLFNYTCGGEQHMTKGILNLQEYYLKWCVLDAIRAIDVVCSMESFNNSRIIVGGSSQGGGISLLVCALDERPIACFSDIPSNCRIDLRIKGRNGMFTQISDYLLDNETDTDIVLDTVSYFDLYYLANQIKCPVFASAGLKDRVCPPEMFYECYKKIKSPKEIMFNHGCAHISDIKAYNEIKISKIKNILI